MTIEHHIPRPPSRRKLAWLTAAALTAASIVLILFVLPAEFRIDPTGFGHLIGLDQLSGNKAATVAAPVGDTSTARYYKAPFRSDVIDIPLTAAGTGEGGDELEYKVRMKKGDSFVYSWSVPGVKNPEEFYFDFHSETPASATNPEAKVVEYLQTTGIASNGVFIAPIDGVHGWYLQNQTLEPVVVHLKLSGFYELVPPGDYGNQAGIEANTPAK